MAKRVASALRRSVLEGDVGVEDARKAVKRMPDEVIAALHGAGGLDGRPRSSSAPGSPVLRANAPAETGRTAGAPQDSVPPAHDVWAEPPAHQPPAPSPMPAVALPPSAAGALRPPDGPAPASKAEARAVLVICFNRPKYLARTLRTLAARLPSYDRPHLYVSQDGAVASVTGVIEQAKADLAASAPDVPFTHLRHPQSADGGDDSFGYMKLARHFGWALGAVFGAGHPRVIVVEDDLEVGADFFEYFTAVAPVLESDATLLAASAYNDIGQPEFVSDASRVYRSDFFPGLGWMLTRAAWDELGPKWPRGYWDDWLREPAQRRGRAFLRPEVSRTRTFGEDGVSHAQFFHRYLSNIRLSDDPVDWRSQDLSYLSRDAYDAGLDAAVAAAAAVAPADAASRRCAQQESALPGSPWSQAARAGKAGRAIRAEYASVDNYPAAAGAFGFIADVKAGVPRTAYRGVVAFRHNGCHVFLVPAGGRALSAA